MSEVRDLVEGMPLTPFVRVAVAADFASPWANAGEQGLGYINSDVTLYLHRPAGEGMDRVRGGEPPRIGRHRDRRMLALRPARPDRDIHRRGAGAAQADGEAAAAVKPTVLQGQAPTLSSHAPGLDRTSHRLDEDRTAHHSRCRFISGRAFSAAPCFAMIFAMRSGAKFMSTKPGAVLATS